MEVWKHSANFVANDQAYLLDLICKRYGGRPSDHLELDEYNSFQFDAGVAFRYNAVDEDNINERMTLLLNGMNAIMKTLGNKKAAITNYKRVVEIQKKKNEGDIVTGAITNMTVTEIVDNTT